MNKPNIADEYFIRDHEFGVAICRHCEYAVKPREIVRHLTNRKGAHRISQNVAQQVFHVIDEEWIDVDDDIAEFPTRVEYPIPGLTIYQDGLLCKMCPQIYRSPDSMRVHWSKEHRFSVYGHTGGPRPSEVTTGREKREDSIQRVVCQRLFRGGFGSHYIEVRQPGAAYEPTAPVPPANQVAHAVDELEAMWTQQQQGEAVIQPGAIDEANPWLDRTGWAVYLRKQTPKQLRICIESPAEDTEGPEAPMRVIWDAALAVAQKSQSITKQAGHLLRIEAARNDMQTIPTKPLQAYMHADTELERHVDP